MASTSILVIPGRVQTTGLISYSWKVERDEVEHQQLDLANLDLSYGALVMPERFIGIDLLFNRAIDAGVPGSAGLAYHVLRNAEIIPHRLRDKLIAFPRTIVSDGYINRYMLAIGFYRGRWTARWHSLFHDSVLVPTYRYR